MVICNAIVSDNRSLGAWTQLGDSLPERCDLSATDHNRIAARAERNVDHNGLAGAHVRSLLGDAGGTHVP